MEPLTVPGTLDSLQVIAEYVAAATTAAGLDERASYRLRLAVDEITTNIITHGYTGANLKGTLHLRVDIDRETLIISIEDSGAAYAPLQHLHPDDLDLPLEQRQPGGMGVYLAVWSVDEFLYQRVGNRNRHILIMNRSPHNEEQ
jgi:anti-sigma regulatory factor (Ser/Thr protein kinase)